MATIFWSFLTIIFLAKKFLLVFSKKAMALDGGKLHKALLLLCIFLFLIDLGDDGRLGLNKSPSGWGHVIHAQTDALSQAVRPLPLKAKSYSTTGVKTPVGVPQIIIPETYNILILVDNHHHQGRGSGGVPL
jgi:hypothetical protein